MTDPRSGPSPAEPDRPAPRAYVAHGANSGFQVTDEIVQLAGNPRVGGGSHSTMQLYSTYTSDVLLTGTHLNRNPGTVRGISLVVGGRHPEAASYDGQFGRSERGTYIFERGARFHWFRNDKHSLALSIDGLMVGIRAPRIGGIDEFHLCVLTESLDLLGADP